MDRVEGSVLAGKYALVSKLGQGGMGSVWRAEHVQLKSPVAIKLIDAQIASNPEALSRFMREAQSAAALRSPHVVQILDFGADQGVPYIAMELLEGESLAGRLERTGRLAPAQAAHVLTHVARAVSRAHEGGVIHRDLKPDNIFLVKNDEEEVAKVLDFGIAKASNPLGVTTGSATRTGAVLGTPYYMSPEQAEGNKLVDHRTDLWALGVIAFECLVGRRPFDSDALGSLLLAICTRPIPVPSSLAPVPAGFDAWFAKACARDADARFQSARDLAQALRQVCAPGTEISGSLQTGAATLGGASTPYGVAPPTGGSYTTSVSLERRRPPVAAIALGAVFLVVVVAGGAGLYLKSQGSGAPLPASAAAEAPAAETRPPAPEAVDPAPPPAATPAPASPPEVTPVPASDAGAEGTVAAVAPERAAPSPPRLAARKPAKVAPKPAPAKTSEPAPAKPEPAPKPASPRVNLGI